MVQYKFNYFNARARGEIVRFIFAAANQQFEDNRVEFANWPALKPEAPLGQMPFLEVKTDSGSVIKIAQSMAIARHLARQFKLAGSNEIEQTVADMWAEHVLDLLNEFIKIHFEKDETRKQELRDKLQSETIPNNLSKTEARLASNNGHLSGNGITYADLYLSTTLEVLADKKEQVLGNFPNIKKLDEEIRNLPGVKAYLNKRPKTDM